MARVAAIDLSQIVGRFQSAVNDPDEMVVFRCDVLGLPRSTTQALTPAVLERARAIETYELPAQTREGHVAYGGLDMGDCCWLFVREAGAGLGAMPRRFGTAAQGRDAGAPTGHRLLAAQKMAAADVVRQAQALFHQLGLAALFIDERPLVNEARSLALALNGLQLLDVWPRIANQHEACIQLPGGLAWDGRNARWLNLKCAVVRFSKSRLGAGIEQTLVFFEEGGQTKFVPCVTCNRFETIDRVVREFLTPTEGMVEVLPDGKVRETPAMRLPRLTPGHSPILTTLEAHLLTGSEREKDAAGALGDYVGGCDNHLLLADAYSALAALVCGALRPAPCRRFYLRTRAATRPFPACGIAASRGDRRRVMSGSFFATTPEQRQRAHGRQRQGAGFRGGLKTMPSGLFKPEISAASTVSPEVVYSPIVPAFQLATYKLVPEIAR